MLVAEYFGGAARGEQAIADRRELRATGMMSCLSRSVTQMKIVPDLGKAIWRPSATLRTPSGSIVGHAHDFAGRTHFRTEDDVHAGKLVEWENAFLDANSA